MTRTRKRTLQPWIYAVSIALHGAFALVLSRIPAPERSQTVAIELAEITKKAAPPSPPRPPPPAAKEPKALPRAAAVAPAAVKTAPAPEKAPPRGPTVGADGFTDLGRVALHGNVGAPAGASSAADEAAPKAIAHRSKQLVPAAATECAEPVVKPKVTTPGQITYTKEGQEAEIEGVVRVQVTVDETGKVLTATVLTGLGYGLDERALAAAKETLFEPATLCGKPVVGTKILAFTFELR